MTGEHRSHGNYKQVPTGPFKSNIRNLFTKSTLKLMLEVKI